MKKRTEIAGSLILIIWVIMMGLLIQKSCFAPSKTIPVPAVTSQGLDSGEEWSGIYFKENKAGYVSSKREKINSGYYFTENAVMNLVMLDVPQRIISSLSAETDNNLLLRKFNYTLTSGIITFSASGMVSGKTVQLKIISGGTAREKTLNLPDVPALSGSMRFAMARSGLSPGATMQRTIFDPLTMSNRTVHMVVEKLEEISVRGQKQLCFRIKETFSGITVNAWINQQGETVKEESPMGFVLLKEPRELATAGIGEDQKVDIVAATGIKTAVPIASKNISCLRLRLRNVSLDGFDLDGGRQKRTGDVVAITLEKIVPTDSYQIPCRDSSFREYLEATPFIQSDDTSIIETARHIIGNDRDAQSAAVKIRQWMQTAIEKIPTMSIPSAVEVLRTRRGDCNEHAILFAALSRAAGIPARVCAGIVYLNGSFYYHAWNEIYLGKWISIDPTMNQFPADVTHVTFVQGGIEQQVALLKIVNRMAIDVLESS